MPVTPSASSWRLVRPDDPRPGRPGPGHARGVAWCRNRAVGDGPTARRGGLSLHVDEVLDGEADTRARGLVARDERRHGRTQGHRPSPRTRAATAMITSRTSAIASGSDDVDMQHEHRSDERAEQHGRHRDDAASVRRSGTTRVRSCRLRFP